MVNPGRRAFILAILVPAGLAVLANWRCLEARGVARRKAVEIVLPANPEDAAVLGRPLAMALGPDGLYVADALDCAIKVFSTDGRFVRSIGRKGSGPGELNFPSGVAVGETGIAVADTLNFRVQAFDRDGRPRGGPKLPFPPDRIVALGPDRLLVTSNPAGRKPGEALLHVIDAAGREIWAGLEARISSDPVADAFGNMILVCPGETNDFFVVHRSGERAIFRYSASGGLLGTVTVDELYRSRTVDLRSAGKSIRLAGFCWAAACDRGRLYLSAPEVQAGRDLGPGRSVSVLDTAGRLLATVDLPCPVHRFLVAGGRMYAVDDESSLRIFEVGR
jgi:6-bladed beta-propeller